MNDVSKKVEKSLHISQDVIAQIVTNSVNEIQDKVKSAVQNMLGLTVAKVNVTICGVDLSEKE